MEPWEEVLPAQEKQQEQGKGDREEGFAKKKLGNDYGKELRRDAPRERKLSEGVKQYEKSRGNEPERLNKWHFMI